MAGTTRVLMDDDEYQYSDKEEDELIEEEQLQLKKARADDAVKTIQI